MHHINIDVNVFPQVSVLSVDKEEASVSIRSLRLEVDVKDKRITTLEEDNKKAKENINVIEDLEKVGCRALSNLQPHSLTDSQFSDLFRRHCILQNCHLTMVTEHLGC